MKIKEEKKKKRTERNERNTKFHAKKYQSTIDFQTFK